MRITFILFILPIQLLCCQTGKLEVKTTISKSLKEASALQIIEDNDLYWTLEDAGNAPILYGLNTNGSIEKSIKIQGVDNTDWEDLTTDKIGNIYIGDFGDNKEKRDSYFIYKVDHSKLDDKMVQPEVIRFTLPESLDSKDFEAFFVHQNYFYVFTKEKDETNVLKVPNNSGTHQAQHICRFELDDKDTKVTAADVSPDNTTIALLNHDKVWLIKDVDWPNLCEAEPEPLYFEHDSQKEGLCFVNDSSLLMVDERKRSKGGVIYLLNLD